MRKPLVTLLAFITILFLGSACGENTDSRNSGCIPPEVTGEFPVGVTGVPDTIRPLILPSVGWTLEAKLPEQGYAEDLVIRSGNELWMTFDNHKVLRYQTELKQWKIYDTIEDMDTTPQGLFVSRDGTLWGFDVQLQNYEQALDRCPLLSRYNPETDRFEFVRDRANILHDGMSISFVPKIREDKNGIFWLILEETIARSSRTALYRFDPLTGIASQVLVSTGEEFYTDLALPPDGNIWLADVGTRQLTIYNPENSERSQYITNTHPFNEDELANENLSQVMNLYVDRSGHLWIDDRGWLDFSNPETPIWHKVVRSPVFIKSIGIPEEQYHWTRPYYTYQSSNGQYWFMAPVGIVRLDMEDANWCLFTTGQSPIVEDQQGNLWIELDAKLYRHSLRSD